MLKPMNPASHRLANSSSTLQASMSGPVHTLLMASGHPMRVNSFFSLPYQESRAVSHRALGSTRRGQRARSEHRCLPSLHMGSKGAGTRVTHWIYTFTRRLQTPFPVPVQDAGKVSPPVVGKSGSDPLTCSLIQSHRSWAPFAYCLLLHQCAYSSAISTGI